MVTADFVVQPGTGLIVWTLVLAIVVPCALVCAAKGRWGRFLVGVFTLIGFLVGALQPAVERSLWWRARERRRGPTT